MAKIKSEGVRVKYPKDMDQQTLSGILKSIAIKVEEAKPQQQQQQQQKKKKKKKDPLVKIDFRETKKKQQS